MEKTTRVYTSRVGVVNDVLKGLLNSVVYIEFIKADGTLRKMKATRKLEGIGAGLQEEVGKLNTKESLELEVATGTISVVDVDKGELRKFVIDRLVSFKEKDTQIVVHREDLVTVERESGVVGDGLGDEEEKKHFDPSVISVAQMIKTLRDKVVRLTFKKKDGTLRSMMATRNGKLIELYSNVTEGMNHLPKKGKDFDSDDVVQKQIERDYVSVFDLEKGEFRSYKPSQIVRYDGVNNVSSWIEFTVKNDAWYDVARNGASVLDYYQEGKRGAKNIGSVIDERVNYEETKKEYLDDIYKHQQMIAQRQEYAKNKREQEELRKGRREKIRGMVLGEAKKYEGTEVDVKVYRELLSVPDKLARDKAFNNLENEITHIQNSDKYYLVAIQVGRDVFYLHPTFIVNAGSGRVYVDNTEEKIFSNIGEVYDSEADWGAEDVLKPLAQAIKGRAVGGVASRKSIIRTDEDTKVRLQRILVLAEQNMYKFKGYGVQLSPFTLGEQVTGSESTSVLRVRYKGESILIHPDIIIREVNGKAKVDYKIQRPTSRGAEFTEYFKGWMGKVSDEQDKRVIKEIGRLILHGLDLRKTVKDIA